MTRSNAETISGRHDHAVCSLSTRPNAETIGLRVLLATDMLRQARRRRNDAAEASKSHCEFVIEPPLHHAPNAT